MRWLASRRSWSRIRPRAVSHGRATDARFFRRSGSYAYGFGLFSRKLSFDDYASMFHGNDERVDVDSLVLSTRLWEGLAEDLLT
jgi:acetylornithine deacetylase/succinyl-diaminopimelate desuccinylase-like protein